MQFKPPQCFFFFHRRDRVSLCHLILNKMAQRLIGKPRLLRDAAPLRALVQADAFRNGVPRRAGREGDQPCTAQWFGRPEYLQRFQRVFTDKARSSRWVQSRQRERELVEFDHLFSPERTAVYFLFILRFLSTIGMYNTGSHPCLLV